MKKNRNDSKWDKLLANFEDWLMQNNFWWDRDAIKMKSCGVNDEQQHFAVFAVRDVKPREIVVKIPKAGCLSAATCDIAHLLKKERLSGGIALIIAVMYERALGSVSRWYPYFQIMPEFEPLPMFWSKSDQSVLKGTELERILESDKALMKEDWNEIVAPFLAKHASSLPPDWQNSITFQSFRSAASLTASRAFSIDREHGMGMVPFADMFNHRTGGEHIHLEDDDEDGDDEDGDDEDGDDEDGDDDDEDDEVGEGEDEDGKEDEEEGEDEHDSEENESEEDEDEDGEDEENDNGDQMSDDEKASLKLMLDITTVQAARAGDELFNTFGVHSNGTLIHRYGFAEPDNTLVTVQIDSSLVDDVLGKGAVKEASKAFKKRWHLEDDYTFEIEPDGGIDDELQLIIWHACADESDLTSKKSSIEHDIASGTRPRSADECGALAEVLTRRLALYSDSSGGKRARSNAESTSSAQDMESWKKLVTLGSEGGAAPAGGGCTGRAAALLLRAQEKKVLETAFVQVLAAMSKSKSPPSMGNPKASSDMGGVSKKRKHRKVEGTPYDPVVYL